MRIWSPMPCLCLDRQRLLGEHRELHAIWAVLTQGKAGYSRHPETLRWRGHLGALALRHLEQVSEMHRRGYQHGSPLDLSALSGLGIFTTDVMVQPDPLEPAEDMRAKLAEKQGGSDVSKT